MVAVNTIGLPEDSPFRNFNQVLLLEDSASEAQAEEQREDNSDKEDGVKSMESQELSRQIDSYVMVLDNDQSRIGAPMSYQIAQPMVTSDPVLNTLPTNQGAPTTTPLATVTPEA